MKNKLLSIIGVLIIVLGIVVFVKWNPFLLWKFKFMFRGWWTLLIIIPSIISILKGEPNIINVGACIVGIVLFLSSRYIITFYWIRKYLIPLVLVLLGAIIIFGVKTKK